MSGSPFSPRVVTLAVLSVVANVAGNCFLSLGMKQAGPLGFGMVLQPLLVVGVALLIGWLLLRLALLSAAEMSLMLPLSAGFGYVLTSVVGQTWLHEAVTRYHDWGLGLILAGVILVGASGTQSGGGRDAA
jgi:multidrug transporter EmrE-like cation transporter